MVMMIIMMIMMRILKAFASYISQPCNEGAQTPEHMIYECKILESQRSSSIRHIMARGGDWPPANDELVASYLNAFSRFIKSIDFQKLI